MEARVRVRWIVSGIYIYSALHILGWYVWLSSSQSEAWLPAFNVLFVLLFMPLNVMAIGICRLAWGTFDLFHARYVVGPFADGAAASLLAATSVAAAVLFARRSRRPLERSGIVGGAATPTQAGGLRGRR